MSPTIDPNRRASRNRFRRSRAAARGIAITMLAALAANPLASAQTLEAPPDPKLGLFAGRSAVEGGNLKLETGVRCPPGARVMRFEHRSPEGWTPVPVDHKRSDLHRGWIVFEGALADDPIRRACEQGEKAIERRRKLLADCADGSTAEGATSSEHSYFGELVALVPLDCAGDGTEVHDPMVRVDPDGPGTKPLPAYLDFFAAAEAEGPDEETTLGLRLGYGLSRASSLELATSWSDSAPPRRTTDTGSPFVAQDAVTTDLLWVTRRRITDSLHGQLFTGPGWRWLNGAGDTFAPSAGLGLEIGLGRRFVLDARLLGRWLAERNDDPWVTEAQLGLGVRLGR